MAKITVAKPFRLNHKGKLLRFDAGVHTVEKEVAEHWFVHQHLATAADDAGSDESAPKKATRASKKDKDQSESSAGNDAGSDESEGQAESGETDQGQPA